MNITSNYDLFSLFITKHVSIIIDGQVQFYIIVPSVKDFYEDIKLNAGYHIITSDVEKVTENLPINVETPFQLINALIFRLGMFKELESLNNSLQEFLFKFFPGFEIIYSEKLFKIQGVTITEDI